MVEVDGRKDLLGDGMTSLAERIGVLEALRHHPKSLPHSEGIDQPQAPAYMHSTAHVAACIVNHQTN